MKTLAELKSTRSIKKLPRSRSSKPRGKSGAYLDLYVMTVEKERLEKELAVLERRRKEIIGQLDTAKKNIEEIFERKNIVPESKAAAAPSLGSETGTTESSQPWKTISLNY
ncbi:MAG: hypothetical protein SFU91_02750 [Chloroherpetonaceae bacterium]|nr:hypothetical protein [Chloroherpetonaceae bacterium]